MRIPDGRSPEPKSAAGGRLQRRNVLAALLLALSLLAMSLLAGCAGAPQQRTLTVLAAASLTESFDELGSRFTAQHPGTRIRFDYQGSSTLAEQIGQGRQADVFASANPSTMDKVVNEVGVVEGPATFARNRLTIAVPAGNPAGISSMADLDGRKVVVCAPQVPCGAAADEAERAAGVRLRPASEENDVKSVLRKVVAGEADAGLVYVTDVRSSKGDVESVEIPPVTSAYPISVLKDAAEPELASEFLAFARGPVGREVLTKHGFEQP